MDVFLERGGHWVVAQFVLFGVILVAGFAEPFPFSFAGHRALGWGIAMVGFVVAVAATFALGRNETVFEVEKLQAFSHRPVEHACKEILAVSEELFLEGTELRVI